MNDEEEGARKVVVKKKKGSPASQKPDSVPDVLAPLGADGLPLTASDHVPEIDPEFPGLDVALVPEEAPPGCADGYDVETRQISLHLSEELPGLRLHVVGEQLFANTEACTLADGEPVLVSMLDRISIKGGRESNVLILDMAGDSFGSSLFVREGGIHADLAEGTDQLLVRGSHESDQFYLGAASGRLMMALSSMARINVWVKGVDFLTASLGPGDDSMQPIQQLNVGLYDVDTGATLKVEELSVPLRAWGGAGADAISGSEFADYLNGGPGDDVLSALGGNDFIDEGTDESGADIMNGGEGLDEISYRWRSQDLRVELCPSTAQDGCPRGACSCADANGEDGEGDTVINFEIVRSGSGDDALSGSPGDDYLYGEEGDDVLEGLGGSDVLQGGVGTDDFSGGENGDICDNDPGERMVGCEI